MLFRSVIDPYDECLHLHLISSLIATHPELQALSHYHYVTDLFFPQFGISPSKEMTSLYKDIMRTIKSAEFDLTIIRDDLKELSGNNGSFYCEYEVFKNIYQLEARSVSRTGRSLFLALLTLTTLKGAQPSTKELNRSMARLKRCIQIGRAHV